MLISDRANLAPIPAGWELPLRNWEIHLRAQGMRPATIDTRIRHVRRLARELHAPTPSTVTESALTAWSGEKNWHPETRHAYHASVRTFLRWFATDSHCPELPTLPSVKRPVPPPRPIPEEILAEVLAEVTDRTELILRLAAELGLRAGEIARLRTDRFAASPSGIWNLTVEGKGGRERILPVPAKLAAMLRRRSHQVNSYWFFPGRIDGHLSSRYIRKLASRALPGTWTLHPLRHRFATVGYQASHDLLSIRQALGHASVQTTTRYTASDTTGLISITRATQLTPSDERNHTMTTIAICNNKGGTGKTTSTIMLATYFSTLGKKVAVHDADPQGSSTDWSLLAAEANDPLPFPVTPVNKRSVSISPTDADIVLIDCPPGDPALIDAALRTADAVIVPTSPSGIEVARMWETLEIITDKPAAVLITSAQLNTTTLEDLLNALDEAGVPTFSNIILARQAIKRAWGTTPSQWHGYDGVADEILTEFLPQNR